MNISGTIQDFDSKFVCDPNILLEGSVSQNFDLGLSSYFMTKKRVTFGVFFLDEFLHFIK